MRAAAASKDIRRRQGIGRGSRVDVWGVAEKLGLEVYFYTFRGSRLQEVTIGDIIVVDARLPPSHQRWNIAHGIGHAVMHRDSPNHVWLHAKGGESPDHFELEAETFAFHLLVEPSKLANLYEDGELAAYYGVPMSRLLTFRLYGNHIR